MHQIASPLVLKYFLLLDRIASRSTDSFLPTPSLFKDPDCPANSHYELCHPPCQGFCAGATFTHLCNPLCAEGCVCDAGYLWSGNKCIWHKQCGCEHNGRYYNVSQVLPLNQRSVW